MGIAEEVRWYEYRPPTVDEYQRFLVRAVEAGAISAEERVAIVDRTPIEGVAAVRAQLAVMASAASVKASVLRDEPRLPPAAVGRAGRRNHDCA